MQVDISKLTRDYQRNIIKRGELIPVDDLHYLFIECNLRKDEIPQYLNCTLDKVKHCIKVYKLKKTQEQKNECRNRTCLEKYGVINVSQLDDIKKQKEMVCLQKYGVTNGAKTKESKEKARQTTLQKYGCENIMQTQVYKDKMKQTLLDKYGVDNAAKSEIVKKKLKEKIPQMVENIRKTKRKNKSFNISKMETQLYELLVQKFPTCKYQYTEHPIYKFTCDFYIPELDLLIEYNGTWTHYKEPYNPNKEEHKERLSIWMEKSKQSKYYRNAIYTWTDLDVRKIKCATHNNLNYLVFYNKKDFMRWYNAI